MNKKNLKKISQIYNLVFELFSEEEIKDNLLKILTKFCVDLKSEMVKKGYKTNLTIRNKLFFEK